MKDKANLLDGNLDGNDKKLSKDELIKLSSADEILSNFENNINQNIAKPDSLNPETVIFIADYIQNNHFYAEGAQGQIFKVPISIDGVMKYFLVAKKRFDHNTQGEFNIHRDIEKLLKNNPISDYVKVPKLYGHFQDPNGESIIIMDYIDGKTFFTITVNEILSFMGNDLVCNNDREADYELQKIIKKINPNIETQDEFKKIFDLYYAKKLAQIKVFPEKKAEEMIKHLSIFLELIHDAGFYHRDLGGNLRNIMVGDDDKIYVIDFGMSTKIDSDVENKDEVYGNYKNGSWSKVYHTDEKILSVIKQLKHTDEYKELKSSQKDIQTLEKQYKSSSTIYDFLIQEGKLDDLCQKLDIKIKKEDIIANSVNKKLTDFDTDKVVPLKTFLPILLSQSVLNIDNFSSKIKKELEQKDKEANEFEKKIIEIEKKQKMSSWFENQVKVFATPKVLETLKNSQANAQKKKTALDTKIKYLTKLLSTLDVIKTFMLSDNK